MSTYRQEMVKMSPLTVKKEMIVSNFISTMFRFMNWLIMMCNRQPGYLNHMANNKDPMSSIDVMEIMKNIIDDNMYCISLKEEDDKKLDNLHTYCKLILNHLDDAIRSNDFLIYDEEHDEEHPFLQNDMLNEVFNLMTDLMSINKDQLKEK
jgi:hypothetical protein